MLTLEKSRIMVLVDCKPGRDFEQQETQDGLEDGPVQLSWTIDDIMLRGTPVGNTT